MSRPNPYRPSLVLLTKLGSLIYHLEEAMDSGGHPADIAAAKALREDEEVEQWIDQMKALALLPVKR